MAAKKSTGRSTAQKTATKRSSGGKTSQKKVPVKEPLHREIGAFICLFLGVLTIFGCFGVDAVLIRFITNLLKGLLQYASSFSYCTVADLLKCGLSAASFWRFPLVRSYTWYLRLLLSHGAGKWELRCTKLV